ncbi:MAG: PHP domain-containing protein [Candidatus Omnitrophica bacterium]|nr:PHP domain-containing protein [Candidatus Omnitrophota bacterium]
MNLPRTDYHIHTHYLGCANSTMTIPEIIQECQSFGVTSLAITDHLNTPEQIPLHLKIRQELEQLEAEIEIFFGVELNFTRCDGDFVFSQEIKDKIGFQFAIGGIHTTYLEQYDLKKLVEIQHRHHLKTCLHPLVDVLVHPYWFGKGEFDRNNWPWFDSMKAIPISYIRELGQVARETGTAIEINSSANLSNFRFSHQYVEEYLEFLAILNEEKVCFSLCSDAHSREKLKTVQTSWQVAEKLGLPSERIWKPPVKSFVKKDQVRN